MSGRFGISTKSVEWYTPKWIFDELKTSFDLDPASPTDFLTYVPAKTKYTKAINGLSREWKGYVWLNPPYGSDTKIWMERMIKHNNGIAFVFSRTDAEWMQKAMKNSTAILFFAGRIAFVPGAENLHKKSRTGAGSCMLAFGERAKNDILRLSHKGTLVRRDNELHNNK